MNSFSDYINKVKAEDKLKNDTKFYVREALANRASQKTSSSSIAEFGRKKFSMKKILVAVSSVAACAILAVGGFAYYNTPVNYVSVDINPSVEFGVNAFNKVVSVEAYNEEGTLLLAANQYTHQSLEKAIDTLVFEAMEQGFVAEDGSTVIAVTAESSNEKTAAKLQNTCELGVNLALNAGETSAVLYTDCINLQLRTQAREAGLSPGKYRLIKILQLLDPSITFEQYKNAKITDIIIKANEMLMLSENSVGQNEDYLDCLERIKGAAQQVHNAYGNTEQQQQNMNGKQNQNQNLKSGVQQQTQTQGSENTEQEQERNQYQYQNQNQNQPSDIKSETNNMEQNKIATEQDGLSRSCREYRLFFGSRENFYTVQLGKGLVRIN